MSGEEVLAVEESTQVEYKLSVICTSVQLTSEVMGDNKQQLVVSTDKIVQLEEKSELLCINDMTLSINQPFITDMTDDVQQDHNKSQLSTGCTRQFLQSEVLSLTQQGSEHFIIEGGQQPVSSSSVDMTDDNWIT